MGVGLTPNTCPGRALGTDEGDISTPHQCIARNKAVTPEADVRVNCANGTMRSAPTQRWRTRTGQAEGGTSFRSGTAIVRLSPHTVIAACPSGLL